MLDNLTEKKLVIMLFKKINLYFFIVNKSILMNFLL